MKNLFRSWLLAILLLAIVAPRDIASAQSPTPVPMDWPGYDASPHRGENGKQFSYACPPFDKSKGYIEGSRLYGTGLYTDDSGICAAGAHAGAISTATGGVVTIEIRPGTNLYPGSTQNNITSATWNQNADGSYWVVLPGASGQPTPVPSTCDWSGTWQRNNEAFSFAQSGTQITGTGITEPSWRLTGTVQANVLTGKWSNSKDSGSVKIVISADCNSFDSSWGLGDNTTTFTGHGTRTLGGGASGQCSQELETLNLPATSPDPISSKAVLASGQTYTIVVSGVVGLFPNTTEGFDALYDYRTTGKETAYDFGSLVYLSDKPLTDWIKASGGSVGYRTDHLYAANLPGSGQSLAVHFHEGGDYSDNGGTLSVKICAGATGQFVLTTDKDLYAANEAINLQFAGLPGNATDWIAIAKGTDADTSYGEWHYTESKHSGTMSFAGLAAGDYEARLYLNWSAGGYNVVARKAFKVQGAGSGAMSLEAPRRLALPNDLVLIPVTLNNATNVANLNFDLQYDAAVAKPEGNPGKGNLLDNALFSANPAQTGLVRNGFAQTSGLSGTGTVVNIQFRIVGKPGDKTPLNLNVTTINDPNGGLLKINELAGEIEITNPDGSLPGGGSGSGGIPHGDCDGDLHLTEVDALCALEMSVQLRPVQLSMDMDNSGDVTSRDAVLILQRAVGQ